MPLKRIVAILAGSSGLIAGIGGVAIILRVRLDDTTSLNAALIVALGMAAAVSLSGVFGALMYVRRRHAPGLAVIRLATAFLLFLSFTLLASFAPVFLTTAAFGLAAGVVSLLREVGSGRASSA